MVSESTKALLETYMQEKQEERYKFELYKEVESKQFDYPVNGYLLSKLEHY